MGGSLRAPTSTRLMPLSLHFRARVRPLAVAYSLPNTSTRPSTLERTHSGALYGYQHSARRVGPGPWEARRVTAPHRTDLLPPTPPAQRSCMSSPLGGPPGSLPQVCAVKAPGFGDNRKANLQDIAVLTGGEVRRGPPSFIPYYRTGRPLRRPGQGGVCACGRRWSATVVRQPWLGVLPLVITGLPLGAQLRP